jgi:hypothetical protein
MSNTAAAILFATAILVSDAAHAAPLTATDGFISLFPSDRFADFSGEGFSVHMISPFGEPPFPVFGAGIVSIATGFDAFGGGSIDVQVDGASCTAPVPSLGCGMMTLTSPRLQLPPADWPPGVNFVATAPFTAAGFLNVGGGFDFVGQGFVEGVPFCFNDQAPCGAFGFSEGSVLHYTFSVSEPPTLVLVVAALGVFGVLFGVRFLRGN